MVRLIAGEFRKLASTRVWLWLLLCAIGLTALYGSLSIAFGNDPDNPTPALSTAEGQRTLFSVGQGAGSFVAVLGAIGFTAEFRHRTATDTFLATPHRWRIVAAKLMVYPLIGIGYGLVCLLVTIGIAVPWLSTQDIAVSLWGNGIPATMVGVLVAVGLFGGVGVGLGALLREQVATVVGLLVYLFVAEPIVTHVPALHDWTIYLPGSASAALTRITQAGQEFLAPWQGGLVLAGYGIALAIAAALLTMRRDVT